MDEMEDDERVENRPRRVRADRSARRVVGVARNETPPMGAGSLALAVAGVIA